MFLILIIILLLFILVTYNKLVRLRNDVKVSKSGIDVYLNQRFDLIPNLVECVKAYSRYEEQIFKEISELRSSYMKNNNLEDGEILNNKMNSLLMIAEGYPELKASEQFLNLQKNLLKIESQLQAARRIYNVAVTNYNTKLEVVPSNVISFMFGFKSAKLFEIEEFKKENVDVDI